MRIAPTMAHSPAGVCHAGYPIIHAAGRPEQDGVALPQTNSQGPSSGEQGWRPIWTAPVNTPVLVRVAGQSEPVVAIRDEDRCWQVAWTGDLLPRPIL